MDEILVRPEVMEFARKGLTETGDFEAKRFCGGGQVLSNSDMLDHLERYARGETDPMGQRLYGTVERMYDEVQKRHPTR